jgi:hypothetical protein
MAVQHHVNKKARKCTTCPWQNNNDNESSLGPNQPNAVLHFPKLNSHNSFILFFLYIYNQIKFVEEWLVN